MIHRKLAISAEGHAEGLDGERDRQARQHLDKGHARAFAGQHVRQDRKHQQEHRHGGDPA